MERGEIVGLSGPSGGGKSTLLRIIAGLETPQRGILSVDGQTLAGNGRSVAPELRRVGMVFQDYALFPHMTAAKISPTACTASPKRPEAAKSKPCWNLSK
jgi:iron(III) transport system ATP-binding protein